MKKKNAAERHLLLTAMQNGEALLDTLASNELVRALPVVSTAVGFLKAVDDVRSAALKAKLLRFITDESLRDTLHAQKIREKLDEDGEAEELGEILFLTLDKVTDLKKPALLARIFAAYLDSEIERQVLLLLAHCIDIAFVGDLEHFIETRGDLTMVETMAVHRLANAGLFESYVTGALSDGGIHYQLSPLGRGLLHALRLNDV
jgi:hypothetical protein